MSRVFDTFNVFVVCFRTDIVVAGTLFFVYDFLHIVYVCVVVCKRSIRMDACAFAVIEIVYFCVQ